MDLIGHQDFEGFGNSSQSLDFAKMLMDWRVEFLSPFRSFHLRMCFLAAQPIVLSPNSLVSVPMNVYPAARRSCEARRECVRVS